MQNHGHEQLLMCSDASVGLKAVIAIHNTNLGPACGGLRIKNYHSEDEAIMDALRLSEAMTYKAAAAGLPLGGGKAVIMADPNTQKTNEMLQAFGAFVERVNGQYVTTTDVGVLTSDLVEIKKETNHVVGLPLYDGGSGDTSVMTGFGIYRGMMACAQEVWGSELLVNKTIAIQGYGKVGIALARNLLFAGANLIIADAFPAALNNARKLDGARVLANYSDILSVECDIFAPCAMGGELNEKTIPNLRCAIVAGGANNQLLEDEDVERLHDRGILYAPDYIINAGGIINTITELEGEYDVIVAQEKTRQIFDTMQTVIAMAKAANIPTARAADELARSRFNK